MCGHVLVFGDLGNQKRGHRGLVVGNGSLGDCKNRILKSYRGPKEKVLKETMEYDVTTEVIVNVNGVL